MLSIDPVMVRDINEIGASSMNEASIVAIGDVAYFMADDGTSGVELWKSEGTEAGTVRVKDIRPGSGSSTYSFSRNLANVNGTLFFSADDGTTGRELWKSDGTEAGTVLVRNIIPGGGDSHIRYLTNVNGTLFFRALDDDTNDIELWKSDGTETGTVRVMDVLSGGGSSDPRNLTNVDGTLFFTASDGTTGRELWKSDGTAAGTDRVTDINPGSGSSAPDRLTNVNGTLFFTAGDGTTGEELWKSDGTEGGTVRVKDILLGGSSNPRYLTNVNGTLFFRANDGTTGIELWKSDGTEAGTIRVTDILPSSGSLDPRYLTNVNGTLFFRAFDFDAGAELWKSDGTQAGTARVKNIFPGGGSSDPRNLTNVNGTLFFTARDTTTGVELWKSDGTEAGTVRVQDIRPGTSSYGSPYSSSPGSLTNVNGTLFFTANDGTTGVELWKSDGAEAGTVRVKDINTDNLASYPSNLTNVNGTLFLTADDGATSGELWKSDGTEAGTVRVKNISPGGYGLSARNLTNVNGTLFFSAGGALWKNDGTEAGTVLVNYVFPGSGYYSYPSDLTNVNGTLFFTSDGFTSDFETTGRELWKSDGTEAGTVRVKEIHLGSGGSFSNYLPRHLMNVNGTLFFTADDGISGEELWKSDGTEAGTVRVKDIRPGGGNSYLSDLTDVGGTLFFRADDGSGGRDLWKSDGTEAGTVRVKDIFPGSFFYGLQPGDLTNVNGTLFFSAFDGTGLELWKSDGTSAGTVRVKDIRPGSGSSLDFNSDNLTDVNGTLFFTADDGTNGRELWTSDGTEAGTVRVKDIRPGSDSSSPSNLTNVDGTLFFSADDGIHGRELWMLDTRPVLSPIADQYIDESDTLTLQVIGTDSNLGDTLTYSLDAAPVGASMDPTTGLFTWTASDGPASFPVTVRVTDSGSPALSSTASFVINVENVLPTVQPIAGPAAAVRGQPLAYSAPFTDPGTLDTHTATIDWGDLSSSSATVQETNGSGSAAGSHVYTTRGIYTIALAITDKDGGSATRTLTVTVGAVSVEPDPLLPGQSALFVGGTSGDDRIQITGKKNSTEIQVRIDSEHPQTRYEQAFAGPFSRIVVYGGAGNDRIQVENSISLPALLDGGAGNDWLRGGSGNSTLLGGDGNDWLLGNAARNLLIGGLGRDVLLAGRGQDILIGGTTDHDQNPAALVAIMQEWGRTDVEYDVRVEHLLGGGGLNGSTLLNRDTVHNDVASDLLLSGSGLDLYFASLDDAVLGKKKKERLIAI